jgi:PAS domain S-box-containing protein/putative nucleotidyltransferase with HDIG domain
MTVLLIEDNPGDIRLVEEELLSVHSGLRIQLECVDRLERALEFLAAHQVQAILVDLSLPDSEGLNTLQRVLDCAPQTPVIVMTGLAHEETGMKALQAGAQDYLIKGQVDGRLLTRSIQYAVQRKQTEMELADAYEFTERIVTSSPVGIFTYKLSGECLSVNAAAAQMVGGTIDQLGKQNFHQIESWKKSGLYSMAFRAINTRKLVTGDVHVLTSFGRDAWYTAQFVTFYSGGEELLLMMFSDITERKRAEQALREKEHLLSEAQKIGRIGSWSYDIYSDTMKFSEEMYLLLDVQPEEFQHNHQEFLALVYPSDRPVAAQWFADIKDGTQAKDLSFRLFHKNGELRYLHCTGAVEFDSVAKPSRFIGTAQDVTERRAAEIQIDQQIKRLTALSEIDRAIISSFDQRYTLGVILSHMLSLLQVDAADVLLLDSEGNLLSYAAGQGFRTKMMEPARVRIGESHAGRAAKERRMIRIADLRETTNLQEFNSFVMAEGFVSYIAVPLVVKGNIKGVLEVYQRSMLQPYQDWLEFFNTLAGQTAIAIENMSLFENLRETNQELVQAYDATIEGWSRAMDLRDRETEGHTQRVTKLTLDLARFMGVDESKLMHVRRGALLHDIGKLGVPDQILFKPGALSAEERAVIEKHVDFAYEMLAPIPYLKPALNIPYFHHEKWDGTGYPLGLKGEQIPLEARIFALVDVWDALLSDRPYRAAWSREQTIDYIHVQTGSHFDPQVVECFLEYLNRAEQ